LAALFYTYPEGFILTSLIVVPFMVQIVFRVLRVGRHLPLQLIGVAVVAVVLILPYLPTWILLLSQELSALRSLSRPGEGIFPGLLSSDAISAVLGSGKEFSPALGETLDVGSLFLGGVALTLCAAGLLRLKSWRIAGAVALSIMIGVATFQRVYLKYDYGLYKVLLLGSLVWLPVMFVGIDGIGARVEAHRRFLVAIASCILLQTIFVFQRIKNAGVIPSSTKRIKWYEQIQGLDKIIGNQAVALACNGDFECEWALYYARRLDTEILKYKGYLQAYRPRIFHSGDNDSVPAYILTDYPLGRSIWRNSTFWLTQLTSDASIVAVDSPNGLEQYEGKKFLWIGDQFTKFIVFSDKERTVLFESAAVLMGPSIRRSNQRRLCIESEGLTRDVDVDKRFGVMLQLHRGINTIKVLCKDKAEVLKQPNGDTRILLLGLLDYRLDPANVNGSLSEQIREKVSPSGGRVGDEKKR
jgi:hypothetical protein